MKSVTAAKKLGIHLPAAPQEFQDNALTHRQLRDLLNNPPEWLQELRRTGPHPRQVVAQKLGISMTSLKASEIDHALTTAEIKELLANQPEWLAAARKSFADHRAEQAQAKDKAQAKDTAAEKNT
ncbi:DUF5997 family protein [Corynebacterium uterequi]|nr:DUF5997 family protein [Corynebacterium uterequi]